MVKLQNSQDSPINRNGDSRKEPLQGKSLFIGILIGSLAGGFLVSQAALPSQAPPYPSAPVVATPTDPAKAPELIDADSKKQLAAIVKASNSYMKFSSNRDSKLAYGDKPDSYGDSAMLARAGILKTGNTYCVITRNEGKDYYGFSQSSSGRVWRVSNLEVTPISLKNVESYAPSLEHDACGHILDPNAVAPYVDFSPMTTKLTYQCDVETTGKLPFFQQGADRKMRGIETWSDGHTKTYAGEQSSSDVKILSAGVKYQVTYQGNYSSFQSSRGTFDKCLRSVDHWGTEINLTDASKAFEGAINLTDVPRYIPTSIRTTRSMFSGASKINDLDISKWDVSEISSMEGMFNGATKFNQNLSQWNVDKAEIPKSFASKSAMGKNPAYLPSFGLRR